MPKLHLNKEPSQVWSCENPLAGLRGGERLRDGGRTTSRSLPDQRINKRSMPFTELEERAYRLAVKCWAAVEVVASKLLDTRYLDVDEVYSLVTCRLPE